MDDNLLFLHNLISQHWLEVEHENEIRDQMQVLAAVLIIGSNEDHANPNLSLTQERISGDVAFRRSHVMMVNGGRYVGVKGSRRSSCVRPPTELGRFRRRTVHTRFQG